MAAKTGIEWTDATWSPIRARVKQDAAVIAKAKGYTSLVQIAEKMAGHVGPHCEHESHGCDNCYAETNNHRCLPVNGTGLPFDRRSRDLVDVFVDEKILMQPLRWKQPRRIFVENQSDLFGEWVTDELIDQVFAAMALCPKHTFQVLTKRAERLRDYWTAHAEAGWRQNVHVGVSVEDQTTADERISDLILVGDCPVRFLSYEPALGPVDISGCLWALQWVIAGGESGPGARPAHPEWFRIVRDECQDAGVPFFFKQWGEWANLEAAGKSEVNWTPIGTRDAAKRLHTWEDGEISFRIGKKAAGGLLDGKEWKEFPA